MECNYQHDVAHSYKIILTDCSECCAVNSLEKMLNNFTTKIESHIQDKKTGSIVKENIENFKRELDQEKERLSKQDYKDD